MPYYLGQWIRSRKLKTVKDTQLFVPITAQFQDWNLPRDKEFQQILIDRSTTNNNRHGYFLCLCRGGTRVHEMDKDISVNVRIAWLISGIMGILLRVIPDAGFFCKWEPTARHSRTSPNETYNAMRYRSSGKHNCLISSKIHHSLFGGSPSAICTCSCASLNEWGGRSLFKF